MRKLITQLYYHLPNATRRFINSNRAFSELKRCYKNLKKEGALYRFEIKRTYSKKDVEFSFNATYVVGRRAVKRGVETTLLRNSIQLVDRCLESKTACTVIDVGANYGFLSLVWAKSISEQGHVYAFEANPFVLEGLRKSIKENKLHQISSIHSAIGDHKGSIPLYLMSNSSNVQRIEGAKEVIEVPMTTLDHFIESENLKQCDLIKIDVDGIEFEILNGCKHIIERFSPIFIIELNDDTRILEFFEEYQYSILDMSLQSKEVWEKAGELPPNIFCVPKMIWNAI